jgi:hypothetical protein
MPHHTVPLPFRIQIDSIDPAKTDPSGPNSTTTRTGLLSERNTTPERPLYQGLTAITRLLADKVDQTPLRSATIKLTPKKTGPAVDRNLG